MKLLHLLYSIHYVVIPSIWDIYGASAAKSVPQLRFSEEPKDVVAEQGSEVVLPCSATGSGVFTIFRWLKDGIFLHIDGTKYKLNGQGSLKIHKLHRIKDNGNIFQCKVSNKYGSILSVGAVVQVAYLDLVFPPLSTSFSTSSSETVEMQAPKISSFPRETYKWQRKTTLDSTFEDVFDGKEGRFFISLDGRTLYIVGATMDDEGGYLCIVSNPHVKRKFTVKYQLGVTASGEITDSVRILKGPSDTTAIEGDHQAMMECVVESRPIFPPDILWLDDENRPLSIDGKYSYPRYGHDISYHRLIINNISLQDDQSVFSCQVTAGNKKIQSPKVRLYVDRKKEIPRFDTRLPVEIKRCSGNDILLPCYATSGKWTWYKNAKKVRRLKSSRLTVYKNGSLMIRNATLHDSGIYQVFAETHGEEVSDTVLTVVEEPTVSRCAGPFSTVEMSLPTYSLTSPSALIPNTVWLKTAAPSTLLQSAVSLIRITKTVTPATRENPRTVWTSAQPTYSIIFPTTDVAGVSLVNGTKKESAAQGGSITTWVYAVIAVCSLLLMVVVVTCCVFSTRRKKRFKRANSKMPKSLREEIELAMLSRSNGCNPVIAGHERQKVNTSAPFVENGSAGDAEFYAQTDVTSKQAFTNYKHNGISNQAFDESDEIAKKSKSKEEQEKMQGSSSADLPQISFSKPKVSREPLRKKKSLSKQISSTSSSSTEENELLYDVACEPNWNFKKDLPKAFQTSVSSAADDVFKSEPLYHVLEDSMRLKTQETDIKTNNSAHCNRKSAVEEVPQKSKFRQFPLSSSDSGDYEPVEQVEKRDRNCQKSKNANEDDTTSSILQKDNVYQVLESSEGIDRKTLTGKNNFYASLKTDPGVNSSAENVYQSLNPSTLIEAKRKGQIASACGSRPLSAVDIRHRRPVPSPRTRRKQINSGPETSPVPSPLISQGKSIPSHVSETSPTKRNSNFQNLRKQSNPKTSDNEKKFYMPLVKTDKN